MNITDILILGGNLLHVLTEGSFSTRPGFLDMFECRGSCTFALNRVPLYL